MVITSISSTQYKPCLPNQSFISYLQHFFLNQNYHFDSALISLFISFIPTTLTSFTKREQKELIYYRMNEVKPILYIRPIDFKKAEWLMFNLNPNLIKTSFARNPSSFTSSVEFVFTHEVSERLEQLLIQNKTNRNEGKRIHFKEEDYYRINNPLSYQSPSRRFKIPSKLIKFLLLPSNPHQMDFVLNENITYYSIIIPFITSSISPFYPKFKQIITSFNFEKKELLSILYLFQLGLTLTNQYGLHDSEEIIDDLPSEEGVIRKGESIVLPVYQISNSSLFYNLKISSFQLSRLMRLLFNSNIMLPNEKKTSMNKIKNIINGTYSTFLTFNILPPWLYMKTDYFITNLSHLLSLRDHRNRIDLPYADGIKFYVHHLLSLLDLITKERNNTIVPLTAYTNLLWVLFLQLELNSFSSFLFYENQFLIYFNRTETESIDRLFYTLSKRRLKIFNIRLYDKLFDDELIFNNQLFPFHRNKKHALTDFKNEVQSNPISVSLAL